MSDSNTGFTRKGVTKIPLPLTSGRSRYYQMGILAQTMTLSIAVAIVVLLFFAYSIIPNVKKTMVENLDSKARGIAASLNEVTAGAVIAEDFSSVVEHCTSVLAHDESVTYLIVVRNDGFALIHHQSGWEMSDLGSDWRPEMRVQSGDFREDSEYADGAVYHKSIPFDYSAIKWGWIHIGLSVKSYDAAVASLTRKVGFAFFICLAFAFIFSYVYARKLNQPIYQLRDAVKRIAQGDLSVRVEMASAIELTELAGSINTMADSIEQRRLVLESIRVSAEQLLLETAWEETIPNILSTLGDSIEVDRVALYQITSSRLDHGVEATRRFLWSAVKDDPLADGFSKVSYSECGLESWDQRLNLNETITVSDIGDCGLIARRMLAARGIKSTVQTPIFAYGSLWGILSVEDCTSAREWRQSDSGALRTIADMLGAAIERKNAVDQLMRAKDTAESASKAKTRFLANMSHEIRTPINGIMGMLQLLQRTRCDYQQLGYIDSGLTSSRALLNVIGDVLDVSKIEAGKLELIHRRFSIHSLCRSVAKTFAALADSNDIDFSYHIDRDVAEVYIGAEDRIAQILRNLLSNAFKFTKTGSITIRCYANQEANESDEICFDVVDTGVGIPSGSLKKIFSSFVQVDDSMTRSQTGTGLGLSICRQLCDLLGGDIWVESQLGKGSKFSFRVKAQIADCGTDINLTAPNFRCDGKQVLLIDSSEASRLAVQDYLERAGAIVLAVEYFEDLRPKLEKDELDAVDLILVDRLAAESDLSKLREIPQAGASVSSCPIILFDRFSNRLETHELLSKGFTLSLPKPISRNRLYRAMRAAFEGLDASQSDAFKALPYDESSGPGVTFSENREVRVLIAEDNAINQQVAFELIQSLGFVCDCVGDGKAAVDRVKRGDVDLVFMDCQMPVMDGYEASRQIRNWERTLDDVVSIPIVALTAHAMEGDAERCLEAGMSHYMTKPIEMDRLIELVKDLKLAQPVERRVSVIHRSLLLNRLSGNIDLAKKLLGKFEDMLDQEIDLIEEALFAGDSDQALDIVHGLKGTAATISATEIAEIAISLERILRSGRDCKSELLALKKASIRFKQEWASAINEIV